MEKSRAISTCLVASVFALLAAFAAAHPNFNGKPFIVEGELESLDVPVEGWRVSYPMSREESPLYSNAKPTASNGVSGVSISVTNVVVRGVEKKALRLELTRGVNGGNGDPVAAVKFPVDAAKYNVLSFKARVDVDDGLHPLIGDTTQMNGWSSAKFAEFFDDFGVSAGDGFTYPWAGDGVPATNFRHHDYPETRGEDGFADFVWDIPHEERSAFKGFLYGHVQELQLYYRTRKIPEGKKIVVTVADIQFTKGAHYKYDEPERYAQWLEYVKNYKPDYSDSSKYLLPPETGRVKGPRPVLVKDGKPQAEIVVCLDWDKIRIDNYFAPTNRYLEVKQSVGREVQEARRAAYTLQSLVRTITGAELPVLTAPSAEKNVKIYLGAPWAEKDFAADIARLADLADGGCDGFAVRVKDGDVYIFGPNPIGTRNGVYAFVENNTDIIWAMANDPDGTIYTETKDLEVVWGDALEKPDFIIRGWQGGNTAWQVANRSNYYGLDKGFTLAGGHFLSPQYYERVEGLTNFNPIVGGRYNAVAPFGYCRNTVKPGERSPEWSEYRTLVCLANPEFLKHAMERVPCVKQIRYGAQFMEVMGFDDNYGVCECPLCTKPIKTLDGTLLTPDKDLNAYYSAWHYDYINRLDNEIQKVWPGYTTSTYAYFCAYEFPPIKVNKTVAPLFCAYYRKGHNEPIFAPVNQNWWRNYKAWAAHNARDLALYDYYGLGFVMQPRAEVHKFDLLAQRDIGFLRNSTEGFGSDQYLGSGEERWCMTRLDWDPDADVEQLHRYFNRRTYREAAPWIDKFRGTIRENWLRWPFSVTMTENREIAAMIRERGLEKELRCYLAEALKAVKNEKSRRLLEKLSADFDYDMSSTGWGWPSKQMVEPMPKVPARMTDADVAFTNNMAVAMRYVNAVAPDYATNALAIAMADMRVTPSLRRDRFIKALAALAEKDRNATAGKILALYRANNDDFAGRAYGWSTFMNGPGGADIRSFAGAFAKRGAWADVAALFDAWTEWDGKYLPVGLRAARQREKMGRLRGAAEKSPEAKALYERHLPAYVKLLEACAKDGATSQQRGDARLDLLSLRKASLAVGDRVAILRGLFTDKFMHNSVRARAVSSLPAYCADADGNVDWALVQKLVAEALDAGDWSNMAPIYYARNRKNDTRIGTVAGVAKKAVEAGRKDVAKAILEDAAARLGYFAGTTAADMNDKPDEFAGRLKALTDALATCGGVLPPAKGASR